MGLSYVLAEQTFIAVVGVVEPLKAFEYLQKKGTIVRPQPQIGNIIRVTVGTKDQNAFLNNLKSYLIEKSDS